MQDQKKIKVLFLPKWYPNRYDPMPGLFIQRQAEVVSSYCDVSVLYVHEGGRGKYDYEVVDSLENNVHVIRIYYRDFTSGPGLLRKTVRLFRLLRASRIGFRRMRACSPDIVHVHVLTRLGLLAMVYRFFTGTPYIITEHWSRYFPQNGSFKGFFRKWAARMVVKRASAVIAVSEKLKRAMLDEKLANKDFLVIPNPVDMDRFTPAGTAVERKTNGKVIIHISCFEDRSKNISGFLRVLEQLSWERKDFKCLLIGDGPDWKAMKGLADELGLLDQFAFFPGMKEQDALVEEIRHSDFLVLSSRYETFGSVVIECLACGIPVVATDVGVAGEVLSEKNGMIVPPDDGPELKKALHNMIDRCGDFDKDRIRASVTDKYNNKIIGEQLYHLYNKILAGRS